MSEKLFLGLDVGKDSLVLSGSEKLLLKAANGENGIGQILALPSESETEVCAVVMEPPGNYGKDV